MDSADLSYNTPDLELKGKFHQKHTCYFYNTVLQVRGRQTQGAMMRLFRERIWSYLWHFHSSARLNLYDA